VHDQVTAYRKAWVDVFFFTPGWDAHQVDSDDECFNSSCSDEEDNESKLSERDEFSSARQIGMACCAWRVDTADRAASAEFCALSTILGQVNIVRLALS